MGSMSDDVDFTGTDATFLQAFREAYVPLPAHRSKPPVDSPGSSEEPELPVYTAIEYDTSSLIRFLHSRGINMRYCGAVYTLTTCALWKRRILMEAVARCIKVMHTCFHAVS